MGQMYSFREEVSYKEKLTGIKELERAFANIVVTGSLFEMWRVLIFTICEFFMVYLS